MLSIIIPALNEEKYLPLLLESIRKQSFKDYEIIVADAGSKDKTINIALKYGCKVIKGGRPASGRNAGARIAKGQYLLFLDSDVILQKGFLKSFLTGFNKKGLVIASCYSAPISQKIIDKILFSFMNISMKLMSGLSPHASGYCILTKKDTFRSVKGFNEKLFVAEDHDFVKKAVKKGKFALFKQPKIWVSVRRLDKDGRVKTVFKYIYCEIYLLFHKDVRKKIYDYEFGNYR